jgi:hypothetical protein
MFRTGVVRDFWPYCQHAKRFGRAWPKGTVSVRTRKAHVSKWPPWGGGCRRALLALAITTRSGPENGDAEGKKGT